MTVVEREVVEAPAVAPVTTRDVLHRAADLLEEFGHVKNMIGSKAGGGFCAVGAVHEAINDLGGSLLLFGSASDALGEPWFSIIDWNNAPERTPQEVSQRFRAAADKP